MMTISDRIAFKQRELERLEVEYRSLYKAVMRPCHRFSKAIETQLKYKLYHSQCFYILQYRLVRCSSSLTLSLMCRLIVFSCLSLIGPDKRKKVGES